MAIQLIFCVETNKKADTDSIYIMETINQWYQLNNQIKISKIYMNSKSRYNSREVTREINAKTKAFSIGTTRVIYCVDTDQYEKDSNQARELNEVGQFCKDNGYDFIWFCHDVEEVFTGNKIVSSQKVKRASAFRRNREIRNISEEKLKCKKPRVCSSNILDILDKYLPKIKT